MIMASIKEQMSKQVTQQSAYQYRVISVVHPPQAYNNQIISFKMSTSKLASFSLAPSATNDKLFRKHKFTQHMISPFEQYKQQLCSNVTELKIKYPVVDPDYIRSLLEELENNVQMVADILDEEHKKTVKSSMEEQRNQLQLIIPDAQKSKPQLSKAQEMKALHKSIIKLLKKYNEEKAQRQQLAKKVALLTKENENLKLMNKQLMNQQMEQSYLAGNQDIF